MRGEVVDEGDVLVEGAHRGILKGRANDLGSLSQVGWFSGAFASSTGL